MQIKSNHTNFSPNMSFKGLYLNGKYSEKIHKTFFENPALKKLAEGEYDLIGSVKARTISSKTEAYKEGRDVGEIVYKFYLSAKKRQKNFFMKLIDFLFSENRAIRAYSRERSEQTICNYIEKRLNNEDFIKESLEI